MQTDQNSHTSDFTLLHGQSIGLQLKRGEVLSVRAGRVVVMRRIRLDNESLVLTTPCARGGVYEATTSEWVDVRAAQAATVRVTAVSPSSAARPSLKFWQNWQLDFRFTTIVVKYYEKINLEVGFRSKMPKLGKL